MTVRGASPRCEAATRVSSRSAVWNTKCTSARVPRLAALLLALAALAPDTAEAQRRFAVHAESGSGLSIAGSDGQALLRRSPVYVEVGVLSWLAHDDGIWLGGALRMEVEDRASIGGVARTGFFARADVVELRPFIGLATYLAPYTLVGPEAGALVTFELADFMAVTTRILVDAFLAGSDLAAGTVLVMANATLGLEIRL